MRKEILSRPAWAGRGLRAGHFLGKRPCGRMAGGLPRGPRFGGGPLPCHEQPGSGFSSPLWLTGQESAFRTQI